MGQEMLANSKVDSDSNAIINKETEQICQRAPVIPYRVRDSCRRAPIETFCALFSAQ